MKQLLDQQEEVVHRNWFDLVTVDDIQERDMSERYDHAQRLEEKQNRERGQDQYF